jgi:ABC-type transport system involved in multi-copper enzyme maturation permease subunit
MDGMVGTWAGIVAYLGSLMVIASTVDAISHERSLGITAWIVTKPVSRLAYLLSKALAHAITAAVTIVIVPSFFCVLLMTLLFEDVPLGHVSWAVIILLVEMTFLSFCIVAIGVPLNAVVWVAVVSLGLWFVPTFVPAIQTLEWTVRVLPSFLPIAAIVASQPGYATDSHVFSIVISSIVFGALLFVASAVLFERQEL